MTTTVSNSQALQDFVNAKITQLYAEYNAGLSSARAELATLRRGANKALSSTSADIIPEAAILLFDGLPYQLRNTDLYSEKLGRAEEAAYMALTLYAKHQQSESKCMNVRGMSLGKAMSLTKDDNGIMRQFKYLCGSKNVTSQMQSLSHIVALFKRKGIGLDYGLLAKDLYFLHGDNTSNKVYVRWCRDMYISPKPTAQVEQVETNTNIQADATSQEA